MSITLLDEKGGVFHFAALSMMSTLEEGLHYSKYGILAGKVRGLGMVYGGMIPLRAFFHGHHLAGKKEIKACAFRFPDV